MYIRSAALKLPRIPYPPFRLTDPFPFSPFAATFATGFMTFAACCFSVAKSERMRYTRSWNALFQRDRTVSWMLSNEMCTTPRYSRILKYAAGLVRFKHDPMPFQRLGNKEKDNCIEKTGASWPHVFQQVAYHHHWWQTMALPSLHSEIVCLRNLHETLQKRLFQYIVCNRLGF